MLLSTWCLHYALCDHTLCVQDTTEARAIWQKTSSSQSHYHHTWQPREGQVILYTTLVEEGVCVCVCVCCFRVLSKNWEKEFAKWLGKERLAVFPVTSDNRIEVHTMFVYASTYFCCLVLMPFCL